MDSGGFMCHQCGRQGTDEKPVARFFQGESGWPHELRYMCAECLFNAVRDGKVNVHYAPLNDRFTGFMDLREDGIWSCYTCCEVKDRVGELSNAYPNELEFLCPDCLFKLVVKGTFTIWPVGLANPKTKPVEAAPTGPTATVNKESGAVSVDGITFRW